MKNFLSLLLITILAGCADDTSNLSQLDSHSELKRVFKNETLSPISFETVSETFVLGSDFTDLQRELLRKKVLGRVVRWSLPVYEISLSDGLYKVNTRTNLLSGTGKAMLPAVVYITPKDDGERQFLATLKTNDVITFTGRVSSILLRTAVIIQPAVLVE